MNRTRLLRRYAPLVMLAAVQLLIIAVVPSKAPSSGDTTVGAGAATSDDSADLEAGGQLINPATGEVVGGVVAGGGPSASGAGARTPGAAGGTASGAAASGVTGDTSHCVGGRQFDPAIWYYAPACTGKWTGSDNGGATYPGVTATTVKVVRYYGKPNPAVDAILAALGDNPTDQDRALLYQAAEKFINSRYELYGRKIELKEVKGQCTTVPPDYVCLRGEMRDLVQKEHPFAVMWLTTLASPAFDELSAQKVINLGGEHFRDGFNNQRRPYRYEWFMGGSQVAKHAAEWYCKRLYGGGQFKARNAGETGTGVGQNAPTNDIRNKTRVLGVISQDDPENKNTVTEFKAELARQCGAKVQHEFYYAQDIGRAEEQRRLGVAKMRENPESTSVMCFCDPVAPVFLYRTAEEQRWYPENVVVGTSLMDTDPAAQAYDGTLNPGGHQYDNAFGLGSVAKAEPLNKSAAARVKKAVGMDPVFPDSYATAARDIEYYLMMANLIHGAGPMLNPANVERGAFAAAPRGGSAEILDPFLNLRLFRPGDYTWSDDMREIYFSKAKVSDYNGQPGTWTDINNGRRFKMGEYATGELVLPPKPR